MFRMPRTLAAFPAALAIIAGLPIAASAHKDDMALGSPGAKVTVVEYASVTCPHCANWNKAYFSSFKTRYIDTQRVRYVLREFPTAPKPAAAAGFILARCSGAKYFEVLDRLWRTQSDLFNAEDPRVWLVAAGANAGLTKPQTDACLRNPASLDAYNARLAANLKDLPVEHVPAFFVNGKLVGVGELTLDTLNTAIHHAEQPPPR